MKIPNHQQLHVGAMTMTLTIPYTIERGRDLMLTLNRDSVGTAITFADLRGEPLQELVLTGEDAVVLGDVSNLLCDFVAKLESREMRLEDARYDSTQGN